MSEDNQKLRSGCPPDYQIFLRKYFENNCPYKFFKDFILTLSFSNKHISFWELKTNCISYEGNQIYVKDNQISNFGCPPTTNFRFEFCYPVLLWWLTQIPCLHSDKRHCDLDVLLPLYLCLTHPPPPPHPP